MKRLVFAGVVLVLVCAADGTASAPGAKAIAAQRKHAATLAARRLLHEIVVPPGAQLAHAGPHGFYVRANSGPGAEFVDLHRYWILHTPLSSVVSFEKEHVPAGFSVGGGETNADGSFTQLRFDWPPHGVATRTLVVSIAERRTRTIVRADAQAVWVYPRSRREVVPVGVREIDVTAPNVTRRVTDPTKIRQLVSWFDRLPTTPPGVAPMCAVFLGTSVSLVFRSASGEPVASAQVPAPRASICDAIRFEIHGKPQTPLIDSSQGQTFAWRLEHLLGLKLS